MAINISTVPEYLEKAFHEETKKTGRKRASLGRFLIREALYARGHRFDQQSKTEPSHHE